MLKLSSALHAESSHRMTKLHKIYWVVHNIANALAPAVTVLYWSLVYDSSEYIFFTNKFGPPKKAKTQPTLLWSMEIWHPEKQKSSSKICAK